MDFVFWIILLVVIVGVGWWLLKRSSSAKTPGASTAERTRTDGALSGGSAAASAEAAGTTGIAGAAGFGRPAEPAAPTTADDRAGASAPAPAPATATDRTAGTRERDESGPPSPAAAATGTSGAGAAAAASSQDARRQDSDEWETQWSEASGSSVVSPGAASRGGTSTGGVPTQAAEVNPAGESGVPAATGQQAAPAAVPDAESHRAPVHHPEYTEPHAPTLPGAETAAVEGFDDAGTAAPAPTPTGAAAGAPEPVYGDSSTAPAAPGVVSAHAATTETADRTQSSALVETGADHAQQPLAAPAPEPAGHLAADEPYGAGSAAAGADGSGPGGYTVKGDAGAMVYYEEGHPDYEQVRADVWFESEAHAEAAGFRAPRRRRL